MLRHGTITAFLYILLLISFPLYLDTTSGAPELDMVKLEIVEDDLSFDVSFNGSCFGTFHCTATLLLNLGILTDSVDVVLLVEPSEHMSVALSEYNFTLTSEEPTREFLAEVTLLHGTSSSLHPVLTIGGSAISQPTGTKGEVVEDSANVDILPFYGAEISFVEGYGEVDQGGSSTFALNIRNTGNSQEKFIFVLTNQDELRSRGITVSMEDGTITLVEGGSKEVPVKINADRDARRGGVTVYVEVYSEHNGAGSREDSKGILTLTVENSGLGAILGFFSSPVYLWGSLILFIIALGGLVYGGLKFREHLKWNRAVRRMKVQPIERDDPMEPSH